MAFLDTYYRAYREFWDKVAPLPQFKQRSKTVSEADRGEDKQNSSVSHRVIDMEWVEAIEKAIPDIDKAIRENRRFIATEDDIVPIEKSRRITTESVRHLAQHTNMIARVDGDQVTPESILNIRREESFGIYENRFLVLLIDTALRFIETRYTALTATSDRTVAHLSMDRDFYTDREKTHYTIDYYSEIKARETFDIHDDVSTMSEFERVQRIRIILSAFAANPMIRSLKGVEPVRPPITRTNLLMKDPAFHACLELFVFLETYTKDGYYTVQAEAAGEMESDMKKRFEDAMDVVHFIVHTGTNPGERQQLEANYDADNKRLAEEAAKAEERRRAEEEARYQERVRAEREAHEQELQKLRAEAEAKIEKQKKDCELAIRNIKAENEKTVMGLKEQFVAAIDRNNAKHDAAIKAKDEKLVAAAAAYEAEKVELAKAHAADLDQEKLRSATVQKQLEEKMRAAQQQHVSAVSALKDEAQKQRFALEKECDAKLAEAEESTRVLLESAENRWLVDRDSLNEEILAGKARERELAEQDASNKRFIDSLNRQLETERRNTSRAVQLREKAEERYNRKIERAERSYSAKLGKQEARSQQRIVKLERQLEKALKKCPYQEVIAAGEDIADL